MQLHKPRKRSVHLRFNYRQRQPGSQEQIYNSTVTFTQYIDKMRLLNKSFRESATIMSKIGIGFIHHVAVKRSTPR